MENNPRLTILVLDDEPSIGECVCMAVALTNNKTICFTNPLKALSEFKKNPFKYNAIFTDLRMPEMNGEEVILRVRKINKEIPIVVITATHGVFKTEDFVNLNIISLIAKPFELRDIELAVKQIQEKSEML